MNEFWVEVDGTMVDDVCSDYHLALAIAVGKALSGNIATIRDSHNQPVQTVSLRDGEITLSSRKNRAQYQVEVGNRIVFTSSKLSEAVVEGMKLAKQHGDVRLYDRGSVFATFRDNWDGEGTYVEEWVMMQ